MFWPFIITTLTEGKSHFSGVRWLSEKTQRHHLDHIPLSFTHICNRAVICLLRVFSLKFGPIIRASLMLPPLPLSFPPSVIAELVQLAVSCAPLCGQCGENAWSTLRGAAGRLWVRDMWPRAQICDSCATRTQRSVGKEEERASERVEVNSWDRRRSLLPSGSCPHPLRWFSFRGVFLILS